MGVVCVKVPDEDAFRYVACGAKIMLPGNIATC